MDTPPMRASDRDREQVTEILNREMSQGRLTLAEFEERVGKVYEARTWVDLRALVADLPVEVTFDGERPTPAPAPVTDPHRPVQRVHHRLVWALPYLLAAVVVLALAVRVPWVLFLLVFIGLRGGRHFGVFRGRPGTLHADRLEEFERRRERLRDRRDRRDRQRDRRDERRRRDERW